jgi:hypothetical protein
MMHPQGGFYQGVTPTGENVHDGDPALSAMIEKLRWRQTARRRSA